MALNNHDNFCGACALDKFVHLEKEIIVSDSGAGRRGLKLTRPHQHPVDSFSCVVLGLPSPSPPPSEEGGRGEKGGKDCLSLLRVVA